ncbi:MULTISPECIES: response regulator [Cellulomonas]|uniref:Two-component system chemotaxis response regulator CheY n=2 Tax=Cellulomonas oligotrophica TaxID=931536 RepID=A0A7Y9FHI6_9CELL|nr:MULTISPECIES: response regulator [Cellulomonas]NYD87283.1 two-component system chemotaxis response regulator CheY [Cellulomonas oligotrophica]TQL01601.1 two-component system chemotaxis response regulator CheY [Cellulomonas sp. SLBN-39]
MIRVLVADDSRVMRQIVIRTLRQAGYDWDVREAADGAQALEAVRADEPDVVLSDWNMPEMTGIDLLRRLRAEGYETPFGFVTSEGSPEMRELAEQAGALFLIAKPFTAESFREVIEPVLA